MTPPRIAATPGGVECNCYVSWIEAKSHYASVGRNDEWAAFTPEQQAAALIAATRQVDSLPLRGQRADPTTPQALHFPRAEDPDVLVDGIAFLALLDRPVPLPHRVLIPCTERVCSIDEEMVFRPWADYIIDWAEGAIVARSGGAMPHRFPCAIRYRCKDVPEAIRRAVCEQALWLLRARTTTREPWDPPGAMMWSDVEPTTGSDRPEGYPVRLSRRGWSPSASRLLKPYVELARVG